MISLRLHAFLFAVVAVAVDEGACLAIRHELARLQHCNGTDSEAFADYCPYDVQKHLPLLRELASQSGIDRVAEFGVRGAGTTFAFLDAHVVQLASVDLQQIRSGRSELVRRLADACGRTMWQFHQMSSLDMNTSSFQPNLAYIDTLHTGGLLQAELNMLAPATTHYIVIHDTTLFAHSDEQKYWSGSPPSRNDIGPGLWPVIESFLMQKKGWVLAKRCFDHNGMTVLARRRVYAEVFSKLRLPPCAESIRGASVTAEWKTSLYVFYFGEYKASLDSLRRGADPKRAHELQNHIAELLVSGTPPFGETPAEWEHFKSGEFPILTAALELERKLRELPQYSSRESLPPLAELVAKLRPSLSGVVGDVSDAPPRGQAAAAATQLSSDSSIQKVRSENEHPELRQLLLSVELDSLLPNLTRLGVRVPADVGVLLVADFEEIGFTRVQIRQLQRAIGAAPASSAERRGMVA